MPIKRMVSIVKLKDVFHMYIVRAELSEQSRRAPDVYVKVEVDDYTARTRVARKTWRPFWNEQFRFLALPSCTLQLKVKRQSKFLENIVLGCITVAVEDLVKFAHDGQEVILNLNTADTGNTVGRIVMRVWQGDVPVEALASVVAGAREATVEGLEADESAAAKYLNLVVKQLGVFVDMGDAIANIHPYAYIVWQATSSVYKVVRSQFKKDQKVLELMAAMEATYSFVDVLKIFPEKVATLEGTLKDILQQTFECALFIQEYAGRGFANRAVQQPFSASSSDRIDTFVLKFGELKRLFDMGVTVQTGRTLLRALTRAGTTAHQQALEILKPANMDLHGRAECLPGTRLDVIAHVIAWATNPNNLHNVLWLNGVAGSGKSTLATSIAKFFRETHRLGAFLFFNRDIAERSDPSNVVRTIAYQLGAYEHRMGDAVSAVLEEIPSIGRANSLLQFTKLLVETLCALDDAPVDGPVLIVLDAMDECGNEQERKALLQGLAVESSKLPSFYRILVTSRPEHDIRTLFEGRPNIYSYRLSLASDATRKDIIAMLQFRLAAIHAGNEMLGLPVGWPGNARIQALADRASGLFVWASTACKFIDAPDPEERLAILLLADTTSDAQTSLDNLYLTALESAGRWEDSGFSADFRDVVGTLLVARNPLSAITIDKLLPVANQRSFHAISRLGCLFYSNAIIRLLHPSFAEFLSDQRRCQSDMWFIDVSSHNTRVAIHCMDLLQGTLKFNICGLTLSRDFLADGILPDDTVYACMFWIEHVCAVVDPSVIEDRLAEFLFAHLLHWLEAMSLLRGSRTAVVMLKALFIWYEKHQPGHSSLRELIHDGYRFSQAFVGFIETHPLLIYTAALPFTPVDTILYRTFHNPAKHPWLSIGYQRTWSPLLSALPGRANLIRHVAFSPDGEQVATGSLDSVLQLWDLASGLQIFPPVLHGSTSLDQVTLAFSSDGTRIASTQLPPAKGDLCRTIIVHDTTSGIIVLGPLDSGNGHFNAILFSPDNKLLACIIGDSLILWDAISGSVVSRSSTDVASVAFFPESNRIVCGSSSMGSITIQEARTGALLLSLLYGHNSAVSALHVGPNGIELVSVGEDGLVILWDTLLGAQVRAVRIRDCLTPLKGVIISHDGTCIAARNANGFGIWNLTTGECVNVFDGAGWVSSLTMSPDGLLVASASNNRLASLWTTAGRNWTSTNNGDRKWHIPVETVSYSPDGSRIALIVDTRHTTLPGNLIHVIDAQTGLASFEPITHQAPIRCLAFSTNGLCLISGSEDSRIIVWDSTTGARLLSIAEGHTLPITSVAFSFDDTRIFSTSRDGTARVWDSISGEQMVIINIPRTRTLPTDNFPRAALSPDGTKIATCTEFGEDVRVWDASTGSQILGPLEALPFRWRKSPSVGFSADGSKILFKANKFPRHEWDVGTGVLLERCLPGTYTGDAVDNIILDSHGRWIIDTATQQPISRLPLTTASAQWTVSCKTSVTIATKENFIVIHFPRDAI